MTSSFSSQQASAYADEKNSHLIQNKPWTKRYLTWTNAQSENRMAQQRFIAEAADVFRVRGHRTFGALHIALPLAKRQIAGSAAMRTSSKAKSAKAGDAKLPG